MFKVFFLLLFSHTLHPDTWPVSLPSTASYPFPLIPSPPDLLLLHFPFLKSRSPRDIYQTWPNKLQEKYFVNCNTVPQWWPGLFWKKLFALCSVSPLESQSKTAQYHPVVRSLLGASKTLVKNYFQQTWRQLLFIFFSWTHSKELSRVPPIRRCRGDVQGSRQGWLQGPPNRKKYCCSRPFVQCFLSLPQKLFPICELGNSRYCCPGSLQMSSPLLGWAEQSFNWTFSSTFCSLQP